MNHKVLPSNFGENSRSKALGRRGGGRRSQGDKQKGQGLNQPQFISAQQMPAGPGPPLLHGCKSYSLCGPSCLPRGTSWQCRTAGRLLPSGPAVAFGVGTDAAPGGFPWLPGHGMLGESVRAGQKAQSAPRPAAQPRLLPCRDHKLEACTRLDRIAVTFFISCQHLKEGILHKKLRFPTSLGKHKEFGMLSTCPLT